MAVLPSAVPTAHRALTGVRRSILAVCLSVAFVLSGLPVPAEATGSASNAERDFAALVNVERAKRGVGALVVRTDIVTVARQHSDTMASQQRLHHNPNFSTQITGWQRLSENVGVGPSVTSIHQALMASEGHRRNILDDRVTEIGIGVTVSGSHVWVTQNFRRPSSGLTFSPMSLTTFGDVSSTDVHAASITRVTERGIANSCGQARYCPTDPVTRAQFATMLVRALDLPATTARTFTDISGPHVADIEALAAAGLTAGCAPDRFCPDHRLTREQMATFFAGALKAAPRPSPFSDVTGTIHDGSIGALHRLGVVNGCTTTTFCPRSRVTRAQTASMIANNLG